MNNSIDLSCGMSDIILDVLFADFGTPGGSCANSDPKLKTIGTLVSNASCQSHHTSVKAVRSICVGLPACRLVVSTTKDTSAFDGKHF